MVLTKATFRRQLARAVFQNTPSGSARTSATIYSRDNFSTWYRHSPWFQFVIDVVVSHMRHLVDSSIYRSKRLYLCDTPTHHCVLQTLLELTDAIVPLFAGSSELPLLLRLNPAILSCLCPVKPGSFERCLARSHASLRIIPLRR